MKRIDEFINKLELNQTTPNERRLFIESLSKKEFSSFLKRDFVYDTLESNSFARSISIRTDLFEEYLNKVQTIIEQFTIDEIRSLLPTIKKEYVTIRNMFTEHLVHLIHNSNKEINIKDLLFFKERIENRKITPEEIRNTLLRMSKEEFSFFICTGPQDDYDMDSISNSSIELKDMYENQIEIIAEILEEYTEDEMVEIIPFINESSTIIRTMLFKCLNELKADEIFLTNAPKYSKDIYSYMMTPTVSTNKDNLIIRILSDPQLYSLYSNLELIELRSLLSNNQVILEEDSNIVNTKEEDIISEAAKFIANIRSRDNKSIKRGILKKLSAKKLHDLLNEVNKGLRNIDEEEISYEEFITLIKMPLDKTILFLNECYELSEEEKSSILNKLFKDNKYSSLSITEASQQVIDKHLNVVIDHLFSKDEEFDFIYKDLLELPYKDDIFNKMLEEYLSTAFNGIYPECMNIFLAQLIEKEKESMGLTIVKEFYPGMESTPNNYEISLGTYNERNNTLSINTNGIKNMYDVFTEESSEDFFQTFMYHMVMIETVLHELRHAYQATLYKGISNVRDLYFLLDSILQYNSINYYSANYYNDSMEVDANLYAIMSSLCLLKGHKSLKDIYWQNRKEKANSLARKRKAPQLRQKNIFGKQEDFIDLFFEIIKPLRIQELREEYPMLDLIASDDGYRADEKEIQSKIHEIEHIMVNEDLSEKDYERGLSCLNFLSQYMKRIYHRKAVRKKLV